jgi:hypothetical protein
MKVIAWIFLLYGCLVCNIIFLGVISVDETLISYILPFSFSQIITVMMFSSPLLGLPI